jgi:hypothetical protein
MKHNSTTFYLSSVTSTNNANKTTMTWDNLDMRKLMGSIYNEYDTFDIKLNSVIVITGNATDANNNVIVLLQGLPFIGIGNSGQVPIALNKIGNNLTSSLTSISEHPTNTFDKPNSIVSLTIILNSVSTNVLSTVLFGHQAYLFTITGIK